MCQKHCICIDLRLSVAVTKKSNSKWLKETTKILSSKTSSPTVLTGQGLHSVPRSLSPGLSLLQASLVLDGASSALVRASFLGIKITVTRCVSTDCALSRRKVSPTPMGMSLSELHARLKHCRWVTRDYNR